MVGEHEDSFVRIREVLKQGGYSTEIAARVAAESPDQAIVVESLDLFIRGEIDSEAELRAVVARRMVSRQLKQMGSDPESPTGELALTLLSNDPVFDARVDEALLATAQILKGE